MAIVKSKLLKELSNNYPNFLKKDLEKALNIVLNEIKLALYKGENVEFRDFGTWSINVQKARTSRNPKTGEEVPILPRRVLVFRPSHVLKDRVSRHQVISNPIDENDHP